MRKLGARYWVTAALTAVALSGCGGTKPAAVGGDGGVTPGWSPVPGQVASPSLLPAAHEHAEPVELRIPSIKVKSRLERLSLDKQGVLESPRDPATAGWFIHGVRPGDPGPAIVAGHVDSRTGPAVFTELGKLHPGAEVLLTDAKGTTVKYVVELVRTYPKNEFPTKDVYGATPDPQLRLITCGGSFDENRGHYVDNVVVYAGLAP